MSFFKRIGDRLLASFGLLVTLLALIALGALIFDVARDGIGRLSWQFLTSYPSRRPEEAGILAALVGSLFVISLTALMAVPVVGVVSSALLTGETVTVTLVTGLVLVITGVTLNLLSDDVEAGGV